MCSAEGDKTSLSARLEVCHKGPSQMAPLKSYKKRKKRNIKMEEEKIDEINSNCNENKKSYFYNVITKLFLSSFCLSKNIVCTKNLFSKRGIFSACVGVTAFIVGFVYHYELHTLHGFARFWMQWENIDLQAEQCTLDMPPYVQDFFRPPVDCAMCKEVVRVDRVKNITPQKFEEKYAYSGRPVVVVDGQKNWSATDVFSFNFFKGIYAEDSPALLNFERECQFFPYETEFRSLKEAFNMSEERAAMKEKPWYIGWSNCDSYAATVLRQHYNRPYFLPVLSEISKTDWIFMGTPGHGAHLHIDHVGNPSWQAQIKGKKVWTLEPPPECYFECTALEVVVNSGEIIVLDTNIWYHGTQILSDELSVTIGSEYD